MPVVSVEIELYCEICGRDMVTTDQSRPGGITLSVSPCRSCMDDIEIKAYDVGYSKGHDDGYSKGHDDALNDD